MERREKAGILPTEETGIPIGRVPSYAAYGICKSDDGGGGDYSSGALHVQFCVNDGTGAENKNTK